MSSSSSSLSSSAAELCRQYRHNENKLNRHIHRAFHADVKQIDGLRWLDAGDKRPEHNGVGMYDVDESKLQHQIKSISSHFAAKDRPFHWIVGPQPQPALEKSLVAHGFVLDAEERTLALALDNLVADGSYASPQHITIKPADNPASIYQWVELWSFWDLAAPEHVTKHWASIYQRLQQHNYFDLFLFHANTDNPHDQDIRLERPLGIGTGYLHVSEGVATIGLVTVLPLYRRRGIGSELLKYGIALAKTRGCHHVTLAASPSIFPLCKKLGFEEFGRQKVYMWHPLSEAKQDGWEIVEDPDSDFEEVTKPS